MSPLVSAPNRGYADWQRVSNYDTDLIYSIARAGAGGPDVTGIIDVSRFAYLGGSERIGITNVVVTVTWASDAAFANLMGRRQFVLSPNVTNSAQYRLQNIGPFMQMAWAGVGNVQFSHNASLLATNRYGPLELIPSAPQLIASVNAPVGAAGSTTATPSDYYAGPVAAVVSSVGGATTFVAQTMTPTGVIVNISPGLTPAANVVTALDFIAPPGAWWIAVLNPGAATTYSTTAVPSVSGSS